MTTFHKGGPVPTIDVRFALMLPRDPGLINTVPYPQSIFLKYNNCKPYKDNIPINNIINPKNGEIIFVAQKQFYNKIA